MKTVAFARMKNAEYTTLSKRILESIEESEIEALGLQAIVGKLREADTFMNEAILKDMSYTVTPLLADTREHIVRKFQFLRMYIVSFSEIDDAAKEAASKLLGRHMQVYGKSIRKLSYAEILMRVGNFLTDLEDNADFKAAITTLGAQKWVDLLRSYYAKMGELDKKRLQERIARSNVSADDGKMVLRTAISNLYKTVEVLGLLDPSEAQAALAYRLSLQAERSNRMVRQRLGISDEAQGDDAPEGTKPAPEADAPTEETPADTVATPVTS